LEPGTTPLLPGALLPWLPLPVRGCFGSNVARMRLTATSTSL
jgi:hypothetical protein